MHILVFFRLYNYICGKHQSHFNLPYTEVDLSHEKRHISYTDGRREGERGEDRAVFLSVFEGPGGRECQPGALSVLCAAGSGLAVECRRDGGRPTCWPLILRSPQLWDLAFVALASSMPFFLPVPSI